MYEWIANTFSVGDGFARALAILIALAIVLLLIGLFVFVLRQLTGARIGGGRNRKPRISIMDATSLDTRRRLVLIRRDNVEHLLLIGGPSDVVVEQNIVRGVPVSSDYPRQAASQLAAPQTVYGQAPADMGSAAYAPSTGMGTGVQEDPAFQSAQQQPVQPPFAAPQEPAFAGQSPAPQSELTAAPVLTAEPAPQKTEATTSIRNHLREAAQALHSRTASATAATKDQRSSGTSRYSRPLRQNAATSLLQRDRKESREHQASEKTENTEPPAMTSPSSSELATASQEAVRQEPVMPQQSEASEQTAEAPVQSQQQTSAHTQATSRFPVRSENAPRTPTTSRNASAASAAVADLARSLSRPTNRPAAFMHKGAEARGSLTPPSSGPAARVKSIFTPAQTNDEGKDDTLSISASATVTPAEASLAAPTPAESQQATHTPTPGSQQPSQVAPQQQHRFATQTHNGQQRGSDAHAGATATATHARPSVIPGTTSVRSFSDLIGQDRDRRGRREPPRMAPTPATKPAPEKEVKPLETKGPLPVAPIVSSTPVAAPKVAEAPEMDDILVPPTVEPATEPTEATKPDAATSVEASAGEEKPMAATMQTEATVEVKAPEAISGEAQDDAAETPVSDPKPTESQIAEPVADKAEKAKPAQDETGLDAIEEEMAKLLGEMNHIGRK